GPRAGQVPPALAQTGRSAHRGVLAHGQGAGALQQGHEVRGGAREVPCVRRGELGRGTGSGVRGRARSLTRARRGASVPAVRLRLRLLTAALALSGCAGPYPQSTLRTSFATAGEAPADAVRVAVIGHQWWWEFRYLDLGLTTANELHLPVGKPVRIAITSADVIHSSWIPRLGGKRDAIPGKTNYIAFRADSTGDYSGQCAEFCGASHGNMRLRVIVDSDSGFGAWAQAQLSAAATPAKGGLAQQGKTVYG